MDGWIDKSVHDWTLITLPDRNWKWRMRHAAIYFAEEIKASFQSGKRFDAIFCSDMLNLAELIGLAPEAIRTLPSVIYFHENQFAYPQKDPRERDFHFSFTNFVSCVAATEVWFNSEFNRMSMMLELRKRAKKFPDFAPTKAIAKIELKMRVQEPGIKIDEHVDSSDRRSNGMRRPLRIVWAARWEHDKNPADLLSMLRALSDKEVDFQVSVIGQRYSRCPPEFDTIKSEFAAKIWRWGYQESREMYWETLRESDVFVSTANHEFFGLSAVESIVAGCYPLLPNRLAYPEVIAKLRGRSELFLYDSIVEDLVPRLQNLAHQYESGESTTGFAQANGLSMAAMDRFGWKTRSEEMDKRISEVVSA